MERRIGVLSLTGIRVDNKSIELYSYTKETVILGLIFPDIKIFSLRVNIQWVLSYLLCEN